MNDSLGNEILPSNLYINKDIPKKKNDEKKNNKEKKQGEWQENDKPQTTAENDPQTEKLNENQTQSHDPSEACHKFFVHQGGVVAKTVEKKKRRNISNVVSSKAVTEDEMVNWMKLCIEESVQLQKKRHVNKTPQESV